ncbi:MAG: hypothetical protein ACREGD_03155 [Candidatus Saccharimonadales bacterium]
MVQAKHKNKRKQKQGTTAKSVTPKSPAVEIADPNPKQNEQSKGLAKSVLRGFWHWFGLPALIYFVLFYVFSPHYLGHFNDLFYLDSGDGFQNVWNIWWVNDSLGEQASNPYFTTAIHWPHGTSLIPQTMNIYNGLVGIPLMNIFGLSLPATVNVAVAFSFVMGGVTMFWFAQKLLKKYWIAILAGVLFTFSSYHFAHGLGHLQLVALQWIPLFLLAFWTLLEKMRYRYALLAAGALFLVLLCDYYYLFWCVIVGAMWAGWKLYRRELQLTAHNIKVSALFALTSLVLIGPLLYKLLHLNKVDPLLGSHDPAVFGLDPLSLVLPGGMSHWRSLTDWHWLHIPYASETSMFFGFALLTVLVIAFYKTVIKRKTFKPPRWISFWWIVLLVFGLLSLGPHPTAFGRILESVPLPYWFLEKVFPTLQISGMPIRWILIVLIAAIIIVCYMLTRLDLTTRWGKILLILFVVVSFVELYPAPLPLTTTSVPAYVHQLKQLPEGAVIDNAALTGGWQLRNQTIHEKPIAFGYVTRLPKSVDEKDFQIFADLEQGRYSELCTEHRIRYVTLPPERPLATTEFPIIYQDKEAIIYDLTKAGDC